MNKKYLIAKATRCLFFTALMSGLIQAHAQGQRVGKIELEEIIVTSKRSPIGLNQVTENAVVVGEDEIAQLPARDLSEALRYVAGVDIEPRQGFGRATAISIQGCDSRQVRVMIDGIPLNSQSSGQVNPAQFPIENIARIEIIKGASSSIWGSSLGGVINVITKDTGETLIPKGSVTTAFAEFHTKKQNGEIYGKAGGLGYYLFSSYMESGGRNPKDDVLEKKAFGKLSYDLKALGKLSASFGYSGAKVNSGEFPDGTWQTQPYRARYGKIGWEANLDDVEIRVDLKHSRQEIITESFLSIADQEPFWRVETRDFLYQLSPNVAMHPRGKDLLILGADFDWDIIKSNLYLAQAKSLTLQAPYANYTLKLEPWDFNFGLRFDRNSEFGKEVSPSLGLVYHLKQIPDTFFKAEFARAFNAPPLLWEYNDDVLLGIAPNPDITPERAWVGEASLESRPLPKLWVKCAIYRAEVSNAIALAENEAGLWYMKNFEEFRRQGAELQFKINILEGLNFAASGAFNDIQNILTEETVRGGGKPRQSFDLGLEYKNKNGFSLSARGYYDYWNEPAYAQSNDRKMLCDLKAAQEFKNFTAFLNIHNLTNSKYWQDYYFPLPPRYFEGGITFTW
ncbi:MAG: TonB-dependent receptor [Candidatus Omnitrophica bacterium]|nr:TonB-dependent receptor [Candidatus Omnitrophota bacterium]